MVQLVATNMRRAGILLPRVDQRQWEKKDIRFAMSEFFGSLSRTIGKPSGGADEQPVRAEIYSVERLEQYAQSLAAAHKTVTRKGRAQLLPRLEDNGRKLVLAYHTLVEAIRSGRSISPAAEWLVDNFHIVEEQLREIREDLPKAYYNELPKLVEGELKDFPRIYIVALALIAHTDCRLDTATLRRFIAAYQTVAPLSIGELWAVAITLRLALVENLRRLAVLIVRAREDREQADKLADKLLELATRRPDELVSLVSERFGKREKIPQSFVVQLTQRLREQDPAVMPVTEWLEKQLSRQDVTVEQIIHAEHQRQAATQVTVGNIITSMRLLSTLDWRDFFESVSLIEPVLGLDPAGAYAKMEFASRDRYRHVIERISKRTRSNELKVARTAVELAEGAAKTKADGTAAKTEDQVESYLHQRPESHVGYYLVGEGLPQLEASFAYRPKLIERLRRYVLRHATGFYLGTLTFITWLVVTLLVVGVYVSTGSANLISNWALLVITTLLALIPASDLAVSVLNWDVTHFFPPRLVPRMETAAGIPEAACTMIVVPTIFSSESQVQALVERLEVHFLANQAQHIYFALLGDFRDADTEETPNDSLLIEAAEAGIAELNYRHNQGESARFHLFHRRRQWNPGEGRWIGWERKRGKLEEFNRLLRGATDTSFVGKSGDASLLQKVRYVITLDTDTQLPRDAARKLVGAAIHPLNRPQLDPARRFVTRGYGIVQPRVSISLVSASRSRFARIFSGNTGIDPYTTAVSDAYQDLFCEGNFTGKGLYDVDAFEAALRDRVGENKLLSHDLFESLFARAALATDIELLDDYPASYDAYAKRQHRWTRGDWQILRWLFPTVPDANGRKVPNPLPLISRWKIFDNLRRSLVAPFMFLWLLAAWTVLPGSPLLWSLFVVVTIAFPVYLHVTTSLLIHPRGIPWTSHFWSVWGDVRTNTAQVALSLIFLPHQAYLMTDAIVRTVYRKLFSQKKLLEWVTAADAEKNARGDLVDFFWLMLPAELLALLALALTLIFKPAAYGVMTAFVAVWLVSPFIAHVISALRPPERKLISAEDAQFARQVARRTWRFFEAFVSADDNWLPPDNFQEDPAPIMAHRTSPTNIGLLFLATVSAHDLGYIASLEFVERTELTFTTLEKLGKFRGHFFNWYDTQSLQPLQPEYISTVDSGNMAGHAIALKEACIDFPDTKLFGARNVQGLSDTLAAVAVELDQLGSFRQRTDVVTVSQLRDEIESCQELVLGADIDSLPSWFLLFEALQERTSEIEDIINALAHEHGETNFKELRWWLGALQHQVSSCRRDADTLVPWGRLFSELQAVSANPDTETASALSQLAVLLYNVPTLAELPQFADVALVQLAVLRGNLSDEPVAAFDKLTRAIEQGAVAAGDLLSRLSSLAHTAERTKEEMDFKFLLDPERKVFTIGYNVSAQTADNSYYDLLASEARVASFVAIAKGDVPQEHWFRLGRQLTSVDGGRALISWTGTMFEYLMPLLVMRDYQGTLLNETYRSVVNRQIEYGEERGVPWGISESAYNVRDLHLNYQYGPFGVPGLGLKRGLIEDLVVAPYATMLAAPINPKAAMNNLRRLAKEGALGGYGFFEAIDYTAERLPQAQSRTLIRAFMAHHQGMSLVALNNVLHDECMEKRFHAEPSVQATELLLQERIPVGVPAAHPRAEDVLTGRVMKTAEGLITRVYHNVDTESPRTQLLSNGAYNVMVTVAGGGYSNCGVNAVTRWREDVTRDNWGTFIYVRDVRSGAVWSAGYQPIRKQPQAYEVAFAEDKADFRRTDAGIKTHMEVVVSAEDNAEVRRVSLTNSSTRTREIELTSYAEVVLNTPQADIAHPAFSNLFIETEFFAQENAILAHRRQRSSEDEPIWAAHVVVVEGDSVGTVQYETDRGRFLGRGHTPADPIAVMEDRPLSNTTGAVLDPVFSLRRRVRIPPGATVRCSFSTIVAHSREQAMMLADKYHDPSTFERELRLAWTKAQVEMSHLGIDADEAHLFQRLASRIVYSDPSLRPRSHVLALNTLAQSSLWAHGISGDLPILVVRIADAADLPTVRKLVRGHEYLHYKGLKIDLVILNDNPTTYLQLLHKELDTLLRTSGLGGLQDKPGGAFLRRTDQMSEPDRILLHSVARAVIVCERGPLADQLERPEVTEVLPATFVPRLPAQTYPETTVARPELDFFNGLGGFHQGGREYVILLGAGQWTPAPWSNIIANKNDFGFQVTETGSGYTWSVNSRENRLTPWSNDAISDPPGEIVYLRDEETGTVWSATPLPIRKAEPYIVRHGQGYTVFEHTSHGISQELLLFAPLETPVKVSLLRLRNRTGRKRKLTVTLYNELVLGVQRNTSAPYVITEIDRAAGSIFAHNPFNNEFAGRVTFAATSERLSSATCDRKEFLGRNGTLSQPAALRRLNLAGRDGAGLDPCAALQVTIELAPHEGREIHFLLGEAASREEAQSLIAKFVQAANVNEAFEDVVAHWDTLLRTVEVKTPDLAMDTMLNRWLLYQTLACRIWARSAFYQSGGAFGFRDQLQDVMALVYSSPAIARQQIVLAAAHQFKEGDVQHWWHPPSGRGVRTRFSDDLLWLPFVATFYANVTGDASVFDEVVTFLEQPVLETGQQEAYMQPSISAESASVFEHCLRALDRSLAVGEHGLPLMGGGDWNDGMNRVGHLGKGESVWVGWFLYTTLAAFAPWCDLRNEQPRAARYREHLEQLKQALADKGWDGDWYRRAYFDDGTPLGSVQNEECRIDSIVQSWSVISGAAESYRAQRAMAAVEEYLIKRGDGLVILFTPPFDKGKLDVGYIKGYLPGVRENGGQYTHAAIWTLIAFAMLGDGERAGELFSLLNPINHSSTRAGLHKYKVEPYVAVGDVYALPPHTGRGGWTWYTGSAGWMYRAGLESILGFKLQGERLQIDPCVPRWWRDFEITYRRARTTYHIKVENPHGVSRGVATTELDDVLIVNDEIPLTDDGQVHQVRVVLGEKVAQNEPAPPAIDTESASKEERAKRQRRAV
ncbi:MAG TPA: glucoamylase family protein [Pyrinomonadaceae bacterium]|nr:glucoamylase family protein [Pyrinomonadaceae bacterium]